jgi:hypothetical protein
MLNYQYVISPFKYISYLLRGPVGYFYIVSSACSSFMKPEDVSTNNWNSRKDAALAMDCTQHSPLHLLTVAGAITKGAGDELGIKRGPKNSHDQFFNTDSQQHMSACTSIRVFMTACQSEQYQHKSHILFWSPIIAIWRFIMDVRRYWRQF